MTIYAEAVTIIEKQFCGEKDCLVTNISVVAPPHRTAPLKLTLKS